MSLADLDVKERLRERLAMMQIGSALDLLQHYPRRYHDRTKQAEISELRAGDEATVFAEVRRISSRQTRTRRPLVEAVIYDGTSMLNVTFFNQPWRAKQLREGTQAAFFGKVDVYRGKRQLTNPVVDILGGDGENTARVVPVYPQSGKADVSSWEIRKAVRDVLERIGDLAEPLPSKMRDELNLQDRTWAYRQVHEPDTVETAFKARRRLRFDEFLRMQVGLVARKRALEREQSGIRHDVDGALVPQFLEHLPFDLTDDQRRAIDEIARDMASPAPMHRLLQGDVGSGKTVVALAGILYAVQGGYQGALMAPTEVLAEQHHAVVSGLLEGLTVVDQGTLSGERPVRAALLTNRTGAAERRRLATELANGGIDVVVGTHALIYGDVPFAQLGVAVIDEQHRFGVEQRALLRGLGSDPDVLVMTATPIPRTAAMLVYGDLDKSELRQMPPGRTPIETAVVGPNPLEREAAYERLRTEVAAGHQAYIVCPLVEGSPRTEAKAATEELERLATEELRGLRLGLLHGQLKAADKEAAMAAFRAGEVDVLVATTVIEVGVDVPNATVMIVEDADRFGLSQLHQLRGRVGRGADQSFCYLFSDPTTPESEARMSAMAESTDGFLLAERDLEIRGAGEVFGERQAGMGDLKLGRIPRDAKYVEAARSAAERLLDADPSLSRHRQLADEVTDLLGDAVEFLFKS
jgi:ATP-dependent DNA helicase RecG